MKLAPIIPMEPLSSRSIPEGDDWIAQIKWDGVRVLTYFDGDTVRLFNRKKNERTAHYPEIIDIHAYCQADSVILDGEVVALGMNGKPSFHEVMRRDGIRDLQRMPTMKKEVPIYYMVFDVVFFNGVWLIRESLRKRLEVLSAILLPNPIVHLVKTEADGKTLFDVVKAQGMEGIVAKRLDAPYIIGQKKHWVKVKNYQDLIAVVGGFTKKDGRVNALLLGLYDTNGALRYIGHAGQGKLAQDEWRLLTDKLLTMTKKHRSFVAGMVNVKEGYWVEPLFTVKVQYIEWTADGSLRQPTIQALTSDPPDACVFL